MKIFSWKINNLKKIIESESFKNLLESDNFDYDLICFQEIKYSNYEKYLSNDLKCKYPYRYYSNINNNYNLAIWCKNESLSKLDNIHYNIDDRVLTLEFNDFLLVNSIVPESDSLNSEKYKFREKWNSKFFDYIKKIKYEFIDKELIICGDMKVAHQDIDIIFPELKKNKVAGFYDNERSDFAYLLELNDLCDVYREINPYKKKSSFWIRETYNQRKHSNGWRFDYFLTSENILKRIVHCDFLIDITGSSHCPITLELE